jgi:carbon starvation protein
MIWLGERLPIDPVFMRGIFGDVKKGYAFILIIYCFFASVLPVWFLLQPRDYLSSYLLYSSVLFGVVGIITGGFDLNFPPFLGFYSSELGAIFPILFITVACGAVSGFHSLVASGTSSKQIDKETDACLIGYGGMLIEGLVAVIALSTVMMLGKTDPLIKSQPLLIYASGMGRFFEVIGLNKSYGLSFGLLALSSFILTTLDTATRIGRYIFEEFFNYSTKSSRFIATIATLILPGIFSLITLNDAAGKPIPVWKFIWPLFGATNQLLGALALLVLFIWLKKTGKGTGFILLPMVFMLAVTISSLFLLILQYKFSLIGIIAMILFSLSIFLIADGITAFIKVRPRQLLASMTIQREG